MKRLFCLVTRCLEFKEPILLVGETGCGKTTICQVIALIQQTQLYILNCHEHTETSDFLGSQRPIRGREQIGDELKKALINFLTQVSKTTFQTNSTLENNFTSEELIQLDFDALESYFEKFLSGGDEPQGFLFLFLFTYLFYFKSFKKLVKNRNDIQEIKSLIAKYRSLFAWVDGPLIQAMKDGFMILVDEISLADDSVLERMNSVLEPGRGILLAEKGGKEAEEIVAHEKFR